MNRLLSYIAAAATMLCSCAGGGRDEKPAVFVSIAPLKPLVEQITGDDFEVRILVPSGASPESFEPSLRQIAELSHSKFLFSVGLIDFEQAITAKIADRTEVVNLSRGIELIEGECSHHHHGHAHAHGIDPHIWSSPLSLRTMAANAFEAIHTQYPDSLKYAEGYARLCDRIDALDRSVREICDSAVHRTFILYHPALTYLARDYGLEQVAIEHEGKEPGARSIAGIIERARTEGIVRIFYQSQFPASVVETIARDMGAEPVEIDPLDEDVFSSIEEITRKITR